ncbi:MAG: hypothetical protein ACRDE8_02160, partial [Ginsengibacter sp.]
MNSEEKQMTEAESLQLISAMINKAKNRFNESGTLYLLWGWLIFFCCIVQFVGLHFLNYDKVYYVWYSTWLLLIYQFFYISKRKRNRKVKMYTTEIIMFVWIVYFITYALLVFILIYNNAISCINPAILATYGMPAFLVGVILKFNPLKVGGICCWLLAIAAPFVTYEYQFLLIAVAVII